jgi:hypothetical protein
MTAVALDEAPATRPAMPRRQRWALVAAVLVGVAGGSAVAVPLGHTVAVARHERSGR